MCTLTLSKQLQRGAIGVLREADFNFGLTTLERKDKVICRRRRFDPKYTQAYFLEQFMQYTYILFYSCFI